MNKHDKRNACRRFNSIVVFGFLILIMFIILQPMKEYSELENRYLQSMPKMTISSVFSGEYMQDVEKYVSDHFVFRDFFVILKSRLEYLAGKTENNNVYVCDNGYLMEKPQQYDEAVIGRNVDAVKALYDTGLCNVTVSVVPPAYEILKENLPKNVYQNTILKLNQKLSQSFSETEIGYVDPTELLRKYKDDYLYFRTDHHLTTNGAYVLYHGLAKEMGYTPLGADDFKISDVSRTFMGTTYSRALKDTVPDIITDYRPLETPRFKVKFPYEGTETDSMYFPAHLDKKDKYAYFLDGNHALAMIESPNKNGKQLLVLKDSYANNLVPFLANHYETIHMIDLRYYHDDVIQYMRDHTIKDVLFLYSASSFMADETIQKTAVYAKNSASLTKGYAMVAKTKPTGDAYFQETAFIGDSLTDGFRMYANLHDSTFLCGTSMTIDGLYEREAPDGTPIIEHITKGGFKKVYIMLGANEYLVDTYQSQFIEKYGKLIDTVKQYSPEAIIYVQSVLPVTAKGESKTHLKNINIRKYNEALLSLAEEKHVYYLDVAQVMTDENGYLIEGSSTDGVHLNKPYYEKWLEYLKCHAINAEEMQAMQKLLTENNGEIDVTALAKTISDTVEFQDTLGEINPRMLYVSYGLDAEKMAGAAGYAGGGATAEEISVFEVKDERDVKQVRQRIDAYIKGRKNSFQSYIPEEMPKLNRPFIFVDNKLIVVCIANDYGKLENTIKEFLKQ